MGYTKTIFVFDAAACDEFKAQISTTMALLGKKLKAETPAESPAEYRFQLIRQGNWCLLNEDVCEDYTQYLKLLKIVKPTLLLRAWVYDSDEWGWDYLSGGKKIGSYRSQRKLNAKGQRALQEIHQRLGKTFNASGAEQALHDDELFAEHDLLAWLNLLGFDKAACNAAMYGPEEKTDEGIEIEVLEYGGRPLPGLFEIHELNVADADSAQNIAILKRILHLDPEFDAASVPTEDELGLAAYKQFLTDPPPSDEQDISLMLPSTLREMYTLQLARVKAHRCKSENEQSLIHLRKLLIHEAYAWNRLHQAIYVQRTLSHEMAHGRLYNHEQHCSIALPVGFESNPTGCFDLSVIFCISHAHFTILACTVSPWKAAEACLPRFDTRIFEKNFLTEQKFQGKIVGTWHEKSPIGNCIIQINQNNFISFHMGFKDHSMSHEWPEAFNVICTSFRFEEN